MNPQREIDPQKGERRRVVSMATRSPDGAWRRAGREMARKEHHDWAAWLCLGLGILCGAGSLYYVMDAISAGR